MKSLCAVFKVHISMREWLSGGVSPCQGEGRGFESRLVLFLYPKFHKRVQKGYRKRKGFRDEEKSSSCINEFVPIDRRSVLLCTVPGNQYS